jgi:hypothetical protein
MEGNLLNPLEIKENWKVKMAEDDIAFLLNRGKLVNFPVFFYFVGFN